MKTTRRFDFDYKPLLPSQSISTISSVPDKQTFNANTGDYTPDYTLTPLVIRANISVIDLDGVIPSGDINQSLTNICWYVIENGVKTLISDGDSNFIVGQEGQSTAGVIQVKRNIDPASPITLIFEAEYVDPRTGQLFRFALSKLIRCSTEAVRPYLEIDSPAQIIYNPIRHAPIQKVKASFTLDGQDIPAAYRAFLWQVLRSDGTWSDVGNATDGYLDYEIEVSADGTEVTVDRSLMGEGLTLRCVALYDPDGSPATQQVSPSTPIKTVTFTRRIPELWGEIFDAPYNIPVTPFIFPHIQIWDVIGFLTEEEMTEHLTVDWLMATNKPSGATLTYQKIGSGLKPQLPTTLMSSSIGGVLKADFNPRDPWAAWADSDGTVLTDAGGKILLIR